MRKKAFFIGIKGVGMTSLALAMQDGGWEVEGSDTGESFITDQILTKRHIQVFSPVTAPIPRDCKLIIYSAAFHKPVHHVRAIPLAQALAEFVKPRRVIAVAGVGGKTTTSAMLAVLFTSLGRDVGYYVGTGSIATLEAPGHLGSDPLYIVEADEYAISKEDRRAKMNLLSPSIVITTNIVHDHPDIYHDEKDTLAVFAELISHIKPGGTWICNSQDPLTAQLVTHQGQTLKGIKIVEYNSMLPSLDLSVFGEQNQLDAQAAVLAAQAVGVSREKALQGIKNYRGAGRRQEFHGAVAGRLLYDDYGHHPSEVAATLKSFKSAFPDKRIILVFESHTYSRTQRLLLDFVKACSLADQTYIMPIFESAREKGQAHQVTPASFAKLIPKARHLNWQIAAQEIWQDSKPGDLILTMGAGFVYKLHAKFKRISNANHK